MDDSLAVRLRLAREDRGLSMSELARRSGIGKGTVSELENGLRGARLDTLFALSTALEVPLGTLIPNHSREQAAAVSGASVLAIPLGTWASDAGTIEETLSSTPARRDPGPVIDTAAGAEASPPLRRQADSRLAPFDGVDKACEKIKHAAPPPLSRCSSVDPGGHGAGRRWRRSRCPSRDAGGHHLGFVRIAA